MFRTAAGLTKAIQEKQGIINKALKLSRENENAVFYVFQKDNDLVVTGNSYVQQICINSKYEIIGKIRNGFFVI